MFKPLTLVSLLTLVIPALARPCVTFDSNFNLLVFGLDGKDWNGGTQDTWASGKATDITASGRPPFDGVNTTCYLAQFFNAVYIMNGDAANPSDIHMYDATAKSWSTQKVDTGNFDPTSFTAILDHDTNDFYALSKDELYFVSLGTLTSANATAVSWVDVGQVPYSSSYNPVMALAQNHIHFLDVPGNEAGEADIFVIHYSSYQSAPQSYPLADGSTSFPATHGQTASFFQASGVQQEFAFIPDDGSQTYVINVETNTTQALAGPTTKDAGAIYAASITALVQLDSTGALEFLPYTEGDAATNAQAKWASLAAISAVAPPGSSSSASATSAAGASNSSTGSSAASSTKGSAASGSQTSTSGSAASSQTGTATQSNDAPSLSKGSVGLGMMTAGILGLSALLF